MCQKVKDFYTWSFFQVSMCVTGKKATVKPLNYMLVKRKKKRKMYEIKLQNAAVIFLSKTH